MSERGPFAINIERRRKILDPRMGIYVCFDKSITAYLGAGIRKLREMLTAKGYLHR